jgi:hypothetical protein
MGIYGKYGKYGYGKDGKYGYGKDYRYGTYGNKEDDKNK